MMGPSNHPIFKRINNKTSKGELLNLIHLMREFPAIEQVMGAEYEVRDRDGTLLFTITKRGLDFEQMQILLEEDAEYQKMLNKNSKKGKK